MPFTESTPLLWSEEPRQPYYRSRSADRLPYWRQDDEVAHPPAQPVMKHKDLLGNNPHAQFCTLVGCPPSNATKGAKFEVQKNSLYGRVTTLLRSQRRAYNFSASLSNTLLLAQVILGAALTGLGASASSHILITVFGATNTIIAGLVAYLKSRGQPMRARMYRDDLERIYDEIENSEVMWRGISEGIHGYEDIDTDEVTVRSEVARLTRLYERAVRLNGMNNPDMYMAGGGQFDGNAHGGPRPNRGQGPGLVLPAVSQPAPQPSAENGGPTVPAAAAPEDAAPATQVIKDDKKEEQKEDSKSDGKKPATDGASDDNDKKSDPSSSTTTPAKPESSSAQPTDTAPAPAQPAAPPVEDPDASPATAAKVKSKRTKSDIGKIDGSSSGKKVAGDDDES